MLTTHRIPSVAESSQFLFDGGLVSYGTDWVYTYKRAASQVAKILKGNQPAYIPIELQDGQRLILREPAVGDIKEIYLIHR